MRNLLKKKKRSSLEESIAVTVKEGVGRTEKSIILSEGSCVEDALEKAGANPKEGAEIRLNGEPTRMSKVLDDGDVVTIMRKVAGACL